MIKRLLPWALIPVSFLGAASFVRLGQIFAPPAPSGAFLVATPNGQVIRGTSPQITVDSVGNVAIQSFPSAVPSISAVVISTTSGNSFPIPSGKSVCDVSLNIPQSPGIDYNITAGNIVFIASPQPGDVLKLVCW